ncbi:hypothetical protein KUCAC02_014460 [Chaenocephalus aceratus]|uniref:Uncharacterized protein n=1 Tax=Chaenocephalus aceratus TaxID=36190 RepID=A0ACB9WFQ4_CHAAC|nr:hypothetical protein KUCAC02_014460 [Chaenocephalus aceratus]
MREEERRREKLIREGEGKGRKRRGESAEEELEGGTRWGIQEERKREVKGSQLRGEKKRKGNEERSK